MKTKIMISLSIATLLLFTACGKSDSSGKSITETLKEKEFIVIAQNISLTQCELSAIKNNINGGTFGDAGEFSQNIDKNTLAVSAEQSNVSCEKYNRSNDDIACTIVDWQENIGTSCVTGFNFEK